VSRMAAIAIERDSSRHSPISAVNRVRNHVVVLGTQDIGHLGIATTFRQTININTSCHVSRMAAIAIERDSSRHSPISAVNRVRNHVVVLGTQGIGHLGIATTFRQTSNINCCQGLGRRQ
jgi:hypothetical protein